MTGGEVVPREGVAWIRLQRLPVHRLRFIVPPQCVIQHYGVIIAAVGVPRVAHDGALIQRLGAYVVIPNIRKKQRIIP